MNFTPAIKMVHAQCETLWKIEAPAGLGFIERNDTVVLDGRAESARRTPTRPGRMSRSSAVIRSPLAREFLQIMSTAWTNDMKCQIELRLLGESYPNQISIEESK